MAVWPLSSTLSLPTLALPAYSEAMVSMVGPIWRHGPHHSAQKSTSTGSGDLRTSLSNAASVKVNVLFPAILNPQLYWILFCAKGCSRFAAIQQPLVQSCIFRRRNPPGIILPHTAPHHGLPAFPVLESARSSADSRQQSLGRVVFELEPGTILDSIIKPAGGANHRHRAVTQAIHLVQAAGLILAGHEEYIGAGLDFVRQSFVITDAHGDVLGMRGGRLSQAGFVIGVARSEHYKIQIIGGQLGGNFKNQLRAFLAGEAGHDAEQGPVHGSGRQLELLYQIPLADPSTTESVRRIVCGQVEVGLGVPAAVIHAIQNSM